MKILRQIIEFFMILGAIPGLIVGALFETVTGLRLNGAISGTLCFVFGVCVFAIFIYGLYALFL